MLLPVRLKKRWQSETCIVALILSGSADMAAISAVVVVPRFEPSVNG